MEKNNVIKALLTGTQLRSNTYSYTIEKVLGAGSYGITYLASTLIKVKGPMGEIDTEMKVAIKEFYMPDFNTRDDDGVVWGIEPGTLVDKYARKFRAEAVNLSNMKHPNIVKVLDCFDANNTFYYVMEYVDGENLNSYSKRMDGVPEAEAVSHILSVARALDYMHSKRMLHRDLKPSNIMRRKQDGHLFLIDFGLSKQYEETESPGSNTTAGLGTPGYAPIEQLNAVDEDEFAPTLDIYALGATFYKILTGQTPPDATSIMNSGLPTAELERRRVSQHTIDVIKAAMHYKRIERLKNAQQFINMLESKPETPQQYVEADEDGTMVLRPVPVTPKSPANQHNTVVQDDQEYSATIVVPQNKEAVPQPQTENIVADEQPDTQTATPPPPPAADKEVERPKRRKLNVKVVKPKVVVETPKVQAENPVEVAPPPPPPTPTPIVIEPEKTAVPEPEAVPEVEPRVRIEEKPEIKVETEPEIKVVPEPEVRVEEKPEVKPEVRTEERTETPHIVVPPPAPAPTIVEPEKTMPPVPERGIPKPDPIEPVRGNGKDNKVWFVAAIIAAILLISGGALYYLLGNEGGRKYSDDDEGGSDTEVTAQMLSDMKQRDNNIQTAARLIRSNDGLTLDDKRSLEYLEALILLDEARSIDSKYLNHEAWEPESYEKFNIPKLKEILVRYYTQQIEILEPMKDDEFYKADYNSYMDNRRKVENIE